MGLLELAKEKFGTLTPAEEKLFKATAEGTVADYSSGNEQEDDPASAENWGPNRTLKADRIAWLCTDPKASRLVTHRGIQVKGARIDGELDLEHARLPFPVYFEKSAFPEGINLMYAEVRGLHLPGTHTGPIWADGVKIAGDLDLRNGFKAEGEVRLLGATIGGDLDCAKGQFSNKRRPALNGDRVKVDGSVFLNDGFKAEGEVRLLGASIGGDLDCAKGQFSKRDGRALSADRVAVMGGVFLRDGFKAEGEVRLLGATIGGNLDCAKGQFSNKDGRAIAADTMTVTGNVYLRDNFHATGTVDFVRCELGSLVCTGIESPGTLRLDLGFAKIGTFWDEPKSWPPCGRLLLHGVTYDELHDRAPTDPSTRLDWLRRQPEGRFHPQPYEQLAAVLRKSGHEEDAKQILVGKAKDEAKALFPRGARIHVRAKRLVDHKWWWYRLFGKVIGYGHHPWRAGWWAAAIVALGCVLFALGDSADIMTPTKVDPYVFDLTCETRGISKDYPDYNALIYSIDSFIPLVDLRVATYYLPNASRGVNLLGWISRTLTTGSLLRVWLWFHIAAGWVLTTLLVVGLTGVVRR